MMCIHIMICIHIMMCIYLSGRMPRRIKLPVGGLDLAGVLPGLLPKAQYDTGAAGKQWVLQRDVSGFLRDVSGGITARVPLTTCRPWQV